MGFSKEQLINLITSLVNYYPVWRIGVTENPEKTYQQFGCPDTWRQWKAESVETARYVEAYYMNLGMKGEVEPPGNYSWVYIFIDRKNEYACL